VREQSKNRLSLITGRYAARQREKQEEAKEAFDDAFRAAREAIIAPVLEDIAAELRSSGHAPRITRDGATETPSIELLLGIAGKEERPGADLIGFSVIRRRERPEVLAYLVVKPPPMDLLRFAATAEITADQVEQIVIDAIEHIFSCHWV